MMQITTPEGEDYLNVDPNDASQMQQAIREMAAERKKLISGSALNPSEANCRLILL